MTSHFQDFINGAMARMNAERREKAENMTLGELIAALAEAPPAYPVVLEDGRGAHGFMSYRGFYEDLAISPRQDTKPCAEVLREARGALGEVFEGYKGGDFPMHKGSIVWVAPYGDLTSLMLTSVRVDEDKVVLVTTLNQEYA